METINEVLPTVSLSKDSNIDIKLPPPPPENPEKTTISMKGDDFMKNFISQPTFISTKPESEDNFTNQDINDVVKQIQKEEAETEKFSMEDMLDIANTIIDIIDTVAATGLRWYAKDNTESPYQLSQDKKKKLARSLARILAKYQTKFSLEFLFLLALIAAYIGPFMRAKEMRKLFNEQHRKKIVKDHEKKMASESDIKTVQEEESPKIIKKPSQNTSLVKQMDISNIGLSNPEVKPDRPKSTFKRPRGRPSKV